MRSSIFDRFSFLSLLLIIILIPVFCIPFSSYTVEMAKGLLLVLGLTLSIVFWAIARFLDGKINLPKSWLLVSGFGVAFIFLISSLLSSNSQVSMFGTMFDIGSFWFIFASFVFLLMSAVVFRTPKQAKIVLLGSILSSALVLIFQVVHLFATRVTSLGLAALTDKTGNIIGSWNALGIFAGFAGLMFLLVIEFFPVSRIEKILLQIFVTLSIFLAATVNFTLVWILLGISSLIIFVYKVSITLHRNEGENEEEKKHFPLTSFVVMLVAMIFYISGGSSIISNFIPSHLQISNAEIGPSFSATMSITKGILLSHPVLGIGPNRFGEAWSMYKPLMVNNTQFWGASFDSGSGLLTTFGSTTGVLGILSWIFFLSLFLAVGFKSVFSSIKSKANWEMMAFFILSLYLFISSFFYSTGTVVFLLSLAFTGVFVGLVTSNSNKEISMSFLNDHRKSFFSILALIIVVILSVAVAFKYIERFASVAYFGRAVSAPTQPEAESNIIKALSLYENDIYWRTAAQVYVWKLNSIASTNIKLSDQDQADFKAALQDAAQSSQNAINYDPQNYINYQLQGSVYQTVGTLGVSDGYKSAIEAYQKAVILNPLNPGLRLSIAGAMFVSGNVAGAKDYANQALNLKPDYLDALVTLSQIAKNQGDNTAALSYAQAALALSPSDKNLIQYVNSFSISSSTTTSPSTTPATTTPPSTKTKK